MSYSCRYLEETFCHKRQKDCDPGSEGCVLEGRCVFGLKEKTVPKKKNKPK